jgi:hypothetical protein
MCAASHSPRSAMSTIPDLQDMLYSQHYASYVSVYIGFGR